MVKKSQHGLCTGMIWAAVATVDGGRAGAATPWAKKPEAPSAGGGGPRTAPVDRERTYSAALIADFCLPFVARRWRCVAMKSRIRGAISARKREPLNTP